MSYLRLYLLPHAIIFLQFAATVAVADGDRYKKVVPLSKQTPKCVQDLPSFGRIEWTVTRLPFVDEGPKAGISGAGMVALGGKIYLAGGFIPSGDEHPNDASRRTSRWTHRYDPATQQWTRLPDIPGRREYTRAIAAEKAIYVMGGACQFPDRKIRYRPFADCFRLDLAASPPVWLRQGRLSVPRTHMAVGRVGRWLIVAGGNAYDFGQGGYSNSTIRGLTEVFDLNRPGGGWQKKNALPGPARGWTAAATCGDQLYVLGGLTFTADGKQHRVCDTVSYRPDKDQWTRHADVPLPLCGWGAAAYADRYILLVGGVASKTPDGLGKHVWNDQPLAYDTRHNRWLRVDGLLPPGGLFNDPGVVILGEEIYVAGAEGPFGTHFNYFLIGKIKPKSADTN